MNYDVFDRMDGFYGQTYTPMCKLKIYDLGVNLEN
jgi:hypothetical protein